MPKIGVPVPSPYEPVPKKCRQWMFLQLEHILAFNYADSDTDSTVQTLTRVQVLPIGLTRNWRSVDLSSEFRIPHNDDKLYHINRQLLASSPKTDGTNTLNLGGIWYLMGWHRYQRLPLSSLSHKLRTTIFWKRRLLRRGCSNSCTLLGHPVYDSF